MFEDPPAGDSIPGVGFKRGEKDCGRGVPQALNIISELAEAGIPSVVVGARALLYYGAKRAPMSWEICVPDDLFDKATTLFSSAPLDDKYDSWPKAMPQPGTLLHSYPRFTLKGFNFFFWFSPAFEYRASDFCGNPDKCEKSKLGVPYPKLEVFAQSLLDTQLFHDLENLVDGMNLTEEWGDEHLDFSGTGLEEYIREKKRRFAETAPKEGMWFGMGPCKDLKVRWQKIVRNKEKRVVPKLPAELYETRFRIRGSGDPRLRDRQV